MGNVTLRLSDGIEKVLKQVKHVPNLKRNLISLKELVKEGYALKGCDGDIKITKGSMVYFRGNIKNVIHLLKGELKMPIMIVDDVQNVLNVQLWHKRLAQINERDLIDLKK